jgi:hypothetical protein
MYRGLRERLLRTVTSLCRVLSVREGSPIDAMVGLVEGGMDETFPQRLSDRSAVAEWRPHKWAELQGTLLTIVEPIGFDPAAGAGPLDDGAAVPESECPGREAGPARENFYAAFIGAWNRAPKRPSGRPTQLAVAGAFAPDPIDVKTSRTWIKTYGRPSGYEFHRRSRTPL